MPWGIKHAFCFLTAWDIGIEKYLYEQWHVSEQKCNQYKLLLLVRWWSDVCLLVHQLLGLYAV